MDLKNTLKKICCCHKESILFLTQFEVNFLIFIILGEKIPCENEI